MRAGAVSWAKAEEGSGREPIEGHAARPIVAPVSLAVHSRVDVMRLATTVGNRATTHVLQMAPDGPTDAGPDGGTASIEKFEVATDPREQRVQMERLLKEKGRNGPRDYLDGLESAVLRATPSAGMAENQPQLEVAQAALGSLREVVAALEREVDGQLDAFTADGHTVLEEMLKDSETRAKAEAIKYGLTEEQIEELVVSDAESGMPTTETRTKYDMPESRAAKGLTEAASQLLQRRSQRIAPLQKQLVELNMRRISGMSPGGGFFTHAPKTPEHVEAEAKLKVEEQEYDGLAAELAGRYPILGSFTKDKDNPNGLQQLASGASQQTAQLIGTQVADTLGKIKRVRAENTPEGDVNVYKLGKVVALTKARRSIADGSWQARLVEEQVASAKETSVIVDVALGLLNLAMVALAPATGGASLIVAAGLSTATAVMHAQEYMLQDAMAGSDVDKARALSQEEPSLFWLAVDIVGAVADIGAGAAAAAKLASVWKATAPAVRSMQVAKTTEELATARGQLKTVLEHEPELLARITTSLDEEGRLGKASKEIEAVDRATEVAKAELKAGKEADSAAGHVHVTPSGRVFSCASPCAEMRARYSEVLASDDGKGMLDTLQQIEAEAAKVVPGDGSALEALAKRAAALDNKLAEVALRVRAQKIASWLPTLGEEYPALRDNPLGVDAIIRIIEKSDSAHIKGQLLEELAASKIEKMIGASDTKALEALAGDRAAAKLEYIGGHRVKDARGKQFTDGMLVIKHESGEIEIVAIIESKSGGASARGLGAEYSSLKPDGSYKSLKELGSGRELNKLTDAELALIEARREAISDLRELRPKKYGKLRIAQIDEAAEAQADIARVMDKMVKTEAGQAVQDIERTVSVGVRIDNAPVRVVKSGRRSTKVVGVLPTDAPAASIEKRIGGIEDLGKKNIKADPKRQGVNFGTMDAGMSAKNLSDLAGEIALRATAPTL